MVVAWLLSAFFVLCFECIVCGLCMVVAWMLSDCVWLCVLILCVLEWFLNGLCLLLYGFVHGGCMVVYCVFN